MDRSWPLLTVFDRSLSFMTVPDHSDRSWLFLTVSDCFWPSWSFLTPTIKFLIDPYRSWPMIDPDGQKRSIKEVSNFRSSISIVSKSYMSTFLWISSRLIRWVNLIIFLFEDFSKIMSEFISHGIGFAVFRIIKYFARKPPLSSLFSDLYIICNSLKQCLPIMYV